MSQRVLPKPRRNGEPAGRSRSIVDARDIHVARRSERPCADGRNDGRRASGFGAGRCGDGGGGDLDRLFHVRAQRAAAQPPDRIGGDPPPFAQQSTSDAILQSVPFLRGHRSFDLLTQAGHCRSLFAFAFRGRLFIGGPGAKFRNQSGTLDRTAKTAQRDVHGLVGFQNDGSQFFPWLRSVSLAIPGTPVFSRILIIFGCAKRRAKKGAGVRRLKAILAERKTRLNAKKDVEAEGNDETRRGVWRLARRPTSRGNRERPQPRR